MDIKKQTGSNPLPCGTLRKPSRMSENTKRLKGVSFTWKYATSVEIPSEVSNFHTLATINNFEVAISGIEYELPIKFTIPAYYYADSKGHTKYLHLVQQAQMEYITLES